MSANESILSYLVVEKQELKCIFQPLKSKRVKYTCLEISQNFLILGATSGGLYIFRRDPCVFLQLIPNKEGPISNIALSFDEKFIAFSSSKGVACVLEVLDPPNESRIINRSTEHYGSIITSIIWTKETNKLYLGDSEGRLSVINVSLFLNKNIFHIPSYIFIELDSAIVQIDCLEEYLLISTKTRCYICDTNKEQYKQIGNQLREGFFGAAFIKFENEFKIYCARPGSRLWEVDGFGNVISTHQFKKALATQSSPVVRLAENELILKIQHSWPDQSFNFCALLTFLNRFILTYKRDGIYIFDTVTAKVLLWSDYYKDIIALKHVNDIIYVWNSLGELHSFVVAPINKCLIQLYFLGKYQLCYDVLDAFVDQLTSIDVLSKLTCLVGLQDHFPDICNNTKVYGFIKNLILGLKKRQSSQSTLDSGIFLVDNKHWRKWKFDAGRNKKKEKMTRSRSMLDINKISLKTGHSRLKCENASLPDIQFSLHCNLTSKLQNFPDDFTLSFNTYISGAFMNQIPFLSLTSPDIIQSTMIELGQNVKKKLFSGTKSLQNKLSIIEGKIKFPKGSFDYKVSSMDFQCSSNAVSQNVIFPATDNSIIYKENIGLQDNSNEPLFEITEICQMSEKINAFFSEQDTFILLNMLVQKLNEHNQSLPADESLKKSFPFKLMFPEKNIEIIKKIFYRSLQSGFILKYFNQFKAFNVKNLEWQEHPFILQEIHKTDDLINDIIMSNIILMFSEIIDPCTILHCLENMNFACYFYSYSIILDIFQEESFNFLVSQKDSNLNYCTCPLPYKLNILFLMLRLDQVESAYHIVVKCDLKLDYISYTVLKLSMHLEFTGINHPNCVDRCNKLFLSLLMKFNYESIYSMLQLCGKETSHHIESAFCSVNKNVMPKCICNYPLIGSKTYSVKFPLIGEVLLKKNMASFKLFKPSEDYNNNLYSLTQQVIFNSCDEDSMLHGYLIDNNHSVNPCKNEFSVNNLIIDNTDKASKQILYFKIASLLQKMPNLIMYILNYALHSIDLCLPFIIQFGKIYMLGDFIEKGSYEFWSKAFHLNHKLSHGFCCVCQYKNDVEIEVDWNQLSILTLRSLGATDTVKLMMSYADKIPSNKIDISFFRACLLSDIIQKENENSSTLIDVYCNVPNFTARRIMDSSIASTEITRSEMTLPHSVIVNFQTELCCYCSLPLVSDKVTLQGKIRIFKCEHIFHISCLQLVNCNFICPLCKSNSCF